MRRIKWRDLGPRPRISNRELEDASQTLCAKFGDVGQLAPAGVGRGYLVSSHGRLFCLGDEKLPPREIKLTQGATFRVTIDAKTTRHLADVVMARAFLERPAKESVLIHVDGDPINHRLDNLRWGSEAEYRDRLRRARQRVLAKRKHRALADVLADIHRTYPEASSLLCWERSPTYFEDALGRLYSVRKSTVRAVLFPRVFRPASAKAWVRAAAAVTPPSKRSETRSFELSADELFREVRAQNSSAAELCYLEARPGALFDAVGNVYSCKAPYGLMSPSIDRKALAEGRFPSAGEFRPIDGSDRYWVSEKGAVVSFSSEIEPSELKKRLTAAGESYVVITGRTRYVADLIESAFGGSSVGSPRPPQRPPRLGRGIHVQFGSRTPAWLLGTRVALGLMSHRRDGVRVLRAFPDVRKLAVVPGFRAVFASDDGRVFSFRFGSPVELLPSTSNGRVSVYAEGRLRSAARLVASAFHHRPAGRHLVIRFLDGNSAHCWPSNLEWVTKAAAVERSFAGAARELEALGLEGWIQIVRRSFPGAGELRGVEGGIGLLASRDGYLYRVSSRGLQKRSVRAKVVKSGTVVQGGRLVSISRARAVAEAFVGRRPAQYARLVHRDGDPTNCRAENLAWIRPAKTE
ncbi:MAG: HNH endonuclease [Deltaproteobacteria bacterium]|nr:HNH endonuclease [Deltaproteobacteria bacterium]